LRDNPRLIDVSVIIPTQDRPASLRRAVGSIAQQELWPKEIIIVDQSSRPAQMEEFEPEFSRWPGKVRILILARPELSGLTAARNLGFSRSSGAVIQFMDDDATLEPKYFSGIWPFITRKDMGGVCARIIEPKQRFHPLAKAFQKIFFLGDLRQSREEWYHEKKPKETPTNILPGVAAYKREVLKRFEFDENLTGGCVGEDIEFSYRASKEFHFMMVPRPKIRHLPNKTNRLAVFRQAEQKTKFYKYHYKKNISKTFKNHVSFIWMNLGFILHAFAEMSPGRFMGTLKGWLSHDPRN